MIVYTMLMCINECVDVEMENGAIDFLREE